MFLPQFLSDHRVAFETVVHPPAYTAQKRAKFMGVSGHHVAKNVLLRGPEGFFLAILPATRIIDLDALARHLGGAVRLASEAEIAEVFRDCELGALTPFGSLYGLPTILEASLPGDADLVCGAQRHAVAVRIRCGDFEKIEKPRRVGFAR